MRTKGTLLLMLLMAGTSLSFAQSKEQLLQQAQSAEKAGNIEGAASAYCDLAKVETSTYGGKCQAYSNLVNKEIENDGKRIRTGKEAVTAKDFDAAKLAFKAVKTSNFKKEAEDWLNNRIPQAEAAAQKEQQQSQQAAAASKNSENIQKAKDALGRGDLATARSLAQSASGPDAAAVLQQISQAEKGAQSQAAYDNAVRQGDSLVSSGKYADAVSQYRSAAALKGSTPGDLQRKIDDAENRSKAAQSGSVNGQIRDASGSPLAGARIVLQSSSGFKETATSDGGGSFHFPSVPPGNYLIAASKDGRGVANSRITVQPGQPASPSLTAAAAPAPGEAGQSDLERAIALFYKGDPDNLLTAEVLLENSGGKGKKKALGDFYMGASKLSRFYLAGANKEDKEQKQMYTEALKSFQQAHKVAGFKPPLEISPKVLRAYQLAR
jgi:hypothetical protein